MASSLLFNRVKVVTSTTGTGTITLGAADVGFCTFAEAGVANGNVVTYTIEDGDDFEIGRGTYTTSGTTLSRDTVLLSKIGGTAGTSKIDLSGSARVFIAAAKEDFDVNDFTEDTAPDALADFIWTHDTGAALKKKSLLYRVGAGPLLNFGTLSGASELTVVLTSFTSFRWLRLVLLGIVPSVDDTELRMQFSTNGGSSYDSSGYSYTQAWSADDNVSNFGNILSASAAHILIAGHPSATYSLSNVTGEGGADMIVDLFGRTTARFGRVNFSGGYFAAASVGCQTHGSGVRENAQDTDAIRVFPESGNISGAWALYGFA